MVLLMDIANKQIWRVESRSRHLPETLKGLIYSARELNGRHSDFIMPKCQDSGQNKSHQTNQKYGFIGPFDYLPNYKNPCWIRNDTNDIQCVPYVYLIGALKCGTTDLFRRLLVHPKIRTGVSKESRWFDYYRFEDPKQAGEEAFFSRFEKTSHDIQRHVVPNTIYHPQILMDGDPHYFFRNDYWMKVPGNEGCLEPRVTIISQLHHLWPQTKLLLILRNPVARLYSAFLYMGTGKRTSENFHRKVVSTIDKWNRCLHRNSFRFCMYDINIRKDGIWEMVAGMYSRYLLDIFKVFPRDQLYIIRTEDFAKAKLNVLNDIFNFLDVPQLPEDMIPRLLVDKTFNKGVGYKKAGNMLEKTRKLLNDFYEPFNKELAAILNDERFLWLDTTVEVAKTKQ